MHFTQSNIFSLSLFHFSFTPNSLQNYICSISSLSIPFQVLTCFALFASTLLFHFQFFTFSYHILHYSAFLITDFCHMPPSIYVLKYYVLFCLCLFFHIFVFIFVFTLIVLSLIHTYLSFLPFSSCPLVQIYHFHFHLHLIFILQPCFNFIYFSSLAHFNSYYILPFLPPRFLYSFQLSSLGNPITNYVFKFSEFSFL
jgi:hypothetical protein